MKLGVLICDQVQEQLQAQFGDYPEMFNDIFARVDTQLDIHYFSAIDRQLPTDIDVCDCYITTGSRWGANDDQLWIRELEDFIHTLYTAGKGFVGICFGHQLIAKSLGGRVEKSSKGWGVGVAWSEIIETQSWMTPAKKDLALIVSHQDQITQLPAQTQILAGNSFCPYSMIRVGRHFLGIQGHPEFTSQYSLALMDSRRDRISASTIDAATATLSAEIDDTLTMEWLINFLKQNTLQDQSG